MSDLGFQVRKGLDRVGFEADKRLRVSRVRAEASRLKKQVESNVRELGEKVLEMADQGRPLDAGLQQMVSGIRSLEAQIAAKNEEIQAITDETWVPPTPPPAVEGAGTENEVSQGQAALSEGQITCPQCGQQVRSIAAFCSSCGYRLQPTGR